MERDIILVDNISLGQHVYEEKDRPKNGSLRDPTSDGSDGKVVITKIC